MMIYLIVFLIGLVFGSFLNVLIHRLPLSISLFKPLGSACPHCSYEIKWFENIPVLSYLFLKGKCSNCSASISKTYPLVEIITATVTLVIYLNFIPNWEMLAIVALFYTLIVLSFIDLKYREVPDYLLIIVVVLTIFVGDLINLLIFTGGLLLLELAITFYIQNIKAKITKNKEYLLNKDVIYNIYEAGNRNHPCPNRDILNKEHSLKIFGKKIYNSNAGYGIYVCKYENPYINAKK